MKKIVLWTNHKNLNGAGAEKEEICLTFLTTQGGVWRMLPLMVRVYRNIKKQFPHIKFYSLSLLLDKKPKVHFFDMRLSLVPLRALKKLCMELEENELGLRKADIDVHVFYRQSGQLRKLSHKIIPIY